MKKKSASTSPFRKLRVLIWAITISAQASTITVTNTNDSGPGSLRQALADSHDHDTITFDPVLNGQFITLTSSELVIDKSITINGPGPDMLAVSRSPNMQFRIFHVMPGFTVTIAGLTISGGNSGQQGGGAILNDHATLTILNSTIYSNHSDSAGGGIYNDARNSGSATLTITNSSVSGNTAGFNNFPISTGEGGGIYNDGGTVMIINSSVSNNFAGLKDPQPLSYGGGISNYGTLTITNSSIYGNQCGQSGGGIYSPGTLTIASSLVSANRAVTKFGGRSGGIFAGTLTFMNSTLSNNYANLSTGGMEVGGGVITNSTISRNNGSISVFGVLEIENTILNASAGSANITNEGGTVTSHGYNLSSDDGGGYLNGPGDQVNTDPMLGPLQDNGGSTFTHALLSGSPAINTGDPSFTPPPSYDQRGSPFVRVFNGRIDIGSFEAQPPRRPSPAPRSRPTPLPRPNPR
jgi:predicted outer membrane repeat protein